MVLRFANSSCTMPNRKVMRRAGSQNLTSWRAEFFHVPMAVWPQVTWKALAKPISVHPPTFGQPNSISMAILETRAFSRSPGRRKRRMPKERG
jgi:hypothetical protein